MARFGRRPASAVGEVESGGGKGVEEPIELLCQDCCTRYWPERQLKAMNPAGLFQSQAGAVKVMQDSDAVGQPLLVLDRAVAPDPNYLEVRKQIAGVSALNLMHREQRVRV